MYQGPENQGAGVEANALGRGSAQSIAGPTLVRVRVRVCVCVCVCVCGWLVGRV